MTNTLKTQIEAIRRAIPADMQVNEEFGSIVIDAASVDDYDVVSDWLYLQGAVFCEHVEVGEIFRLGIHRVEVYGL